LAKIVKQAHWSIIKLQITVVSKIQKILLTLNNMNTSPDEKQYIRYN